MRRRDFAALVAGSLAFPASALGQQARAPFRVAHVSINSLETRRLRTEFPGELSLRGNLCRSYPQGGEGDRADDSAVDPAARRPGYRMTANGPIAVTGSHDQRA